MIDLTTSLPTAVVGAIDSAIRASVPGLIGVSHNGTEVAVHLPDGTSQADQDTAQGVVNAHDPVVLTVTRDGNAVTVTPTKPRNLDSATEVTLTVDGQSLPSASPLGAAATINSADVIALNVETYPCEGVTI